MKFKVGDVLASKTNASYIKTILKVCTKSRTYLNNTRGIEYNNSQEYIESDYEIVTKLSKLLAGVEDENNL